MFVQKPSINELEIIANDYSLKLDTQELKIFQELMSGAIKSYNEVHSLNESIQKEDYSREFGYRPTSDENEYNAWYWKTSIKEKENGKLNGKKIALKDTVSLAGIPMMNGSSLLEGYVADIDATIVKRILEEGGEISGKAACEHLSSSAGSHTPDTGPILNPYDKTRSAGGSSGGSAVLVATGEVDMAIGGDQGGSIRVPSSWCGVYGLKPTYGLVPYTGVFPVDRTLDHVGPMAKNVYDLALLLEVIAGEDPLDSRQFGQIKNSVKSYTDSLTGDIENLRIGIVKEGFSWEGHSEEDVDQIVMEAAKSLSKKGAKVSITSIPMHRNGIDIWSAISTEGPFSMMIKGKGQGTNAHGFYQTKLLDAFANGLKTMPEKLSPTVKFAILLGEYMNDKYNGRYYGIAQNLRSQLREAYDSKLKEFDILVMPTVPVKPTPLPEANAGLEELVKRAYEPVTNTASFNLTGHPALNVPCGFVNELPIGMMFIGRHGEDETLLNAAYAYEKMNE